MSAQSAGAMTAKWTAASERISSAPTQASTSTAPPIDPAKNRRILEQLQEKKRQMQNNKLQQNRHQVTTVTPPNSAPVTIANSSLQSPTTSDRAAREMTMWQAVDQSVHVSIQRRTLGGDNRLLTRQLKAIVDKCIAMNSSTTTEQPSRRGMHQWAKARGLSKSAATTTPFEQTPYAQCLPNTQLLDAELIDQSSSDSTKESPARSSIKKRRVEEAEDGEIQ